MVFADCAKSSEREVAFSPASMANSWGETGSHTAGRGSARCCCRRRLLPYKPAASSLATGLVCAVTATSAAAATGSSCRRRSSSGMDGAASTAWTCGIQKRLLSHVLWIESTPSAFTYERRCCIDRHLTCRASTCQVYVEEPRWVHKMHKSPAATAQLCKASNIELSVNFMSAEGEALWRAPP